MNILCVLFFTVLLRYSCRTLSLEDVDEKPSKFAAKLQSFSEGNKAIETLKNFIVIINLGLLLSAREKVLNNFKYRIFPIKNLDKISTHEPILEVAAEPTKATKNAKNKRKISSVKSRKEFLN